MHSWQQGVYTGWQRYLLANQQGLAGGTTCHIGCASAELKPLLLSTETTADAVRENLQGEWGRTIVFSYHYFNKGHFFS